MWLTSQECWKNLNFVFNDHESIASSDSIKTISHVDSVNKVKYLFLYTPVLKIIEWLNLSFVVFMTEVKILQYQRDMPKMADLNLNVWNVRNTFLSQICKHSFVPMWINYFKQDMYYFSLHFQKYASYLLHLNLQL